MNTGSETPVLMWNVTIGPQWNAHTGNNFKLVWEANCKRWRHLRSRNNLLTVKSWADTGTDAGGSIGSIAGIFVANVIVERYSRPKNQKDIFFSSPVSNASVAQLQTAFPVTGSFVARLIPVPGCKTMVHHCGGTKNLFPVLSTKVSGLSQQFKYGNAGARHWLWRPDVEQHWPNNNFIFWSNQSRQH